jgi:Mg-chelatase subunit ChlD
MAADADQALALLADMAAATDPHLRLLARQLAGRVVVELGRRGRLRSGGTGRLATLPWAEGGDLDLDASLDELVTGRAQRRAPDPGGLRTRRWGRPGTGLSLVVDRSGSMGGERLATAALAAAAVAWRAPADYSVVAFAEEAIVVKAQDEHRAAAGVVEDLLRLRGRGTTNLELGLRAAQSQLARSDAATQIVVLLSDGRPTDGGDALGAARALPRLVVIAPRGDAADARTWALAAGARLAEVAGPSDIPAALSALVDG